MEMEEAPHEAPRRRLAIVGLIAALAVVAVGAYLALGRDRGQGVAIGGPFSLIDQDGRAVTDESYRGRFMLIYFGYTSCPDVCPTTLTELADAMDHLGAKAARVQPLFITVDPKRDTPQVIKPYVASFSPALVGLTGPADAVAQAARAYRVYYAPQQLGPGPDSYTMDHSSLVYLMGPDGRFVGLIPAGGPSGAMAAEIAKLVS